jgi:hypothetical protein
MGVAQRWKALPRAAKWAIAASVIGGAYLGVIDPLLAARQASVFAGDRAARKLEDYTRRSSQFAEAKSKIEFGTKQFGDVALPASGRGAESVASNKIRAALADRGVSQWDIQTARGVQLARDVSEALAPGEGEELQKIVFTVNLTDEPDVVAEVIAEIEGMPEVTMIGAVSLRRLNNQENHVQATLSPETWVVVRREERR